MIGSSLRANPFPRSRKSTIGGAFLEAVIVEVFGWQNSRDDALRSLDLANADQYVGLRIAPGVGESKNVLQKL